MNDRRGLLLMWVGAFALLLLGAGTAIRAAGRLHDDAARMRRKHEELESLRAEKTLLENYAAAVRAMDALPASEPDSFADALRNTIGTTQPEDVRDLYEECAPGWTLHVKELVFSDIPIGSAMSLVTKLEAQRPPWRMARCAVRASSQQPGRGRVMLRLEHLEKRDGPSSAP